VAWSPTQRFADFLAGKGRSLSGLQVSVVETAFALPGTFSDDEVAARLHGQVGRATVYRTLALLVEADLLRRVQFNGRDVLVVTAPDEA
jgi:Fur family transcriptional regulator, ferric uptake regulator